VNEKTQCGAWAKTTRCVSECNAVTLSGHRIGFSEQIYCMGRCRYTATAVEDILNGQRSTTAMGIEILTRTEGHKKFCSRLKTEFLQDKNFLKIRIYRIYIVFLHK
jgi:hypothetical protein